MKTDGESVGGWFSRLPEADRAVLEAKGTARRYQAGTTLFHEGDLSDWVILLKRGRAKVSMTTRDGKEVVLAVCPPGELLGELSAIDSAPRSATTTALDVVDARIVSGEDFRAFLAASPQASLSLLRSVAGRLRHADRCRMEFVALDSIGRVASQLVELAERFGVPAGGGTTQIDLALTQGDLAGLTGASREAVGKALHLFRRHGWIATGRRSLTVIDLDSLRSRAI